ncbi:MAG TPA: nitrous oxide reductase accessory protein NosL [Saprospiraceae bacterium]|nr:nitrous oxide reductase accessory protein NosL [Saprospiraceae bacterium]
MKVSTSFRPSSFTRKFCLKRFLTFLVLCLLLNFSSATAADQALNPKLCKQCGMDMDAYAQSRMLVVYADGTTVGVCSLHCAAAELKQNKDKQVKSLMVADYATKELIDARTATWAVGGNKEGVMTAAAKWAFAKGSDAREFVKQNGGEIASFDIAMKASEGEVAEGKLAGHDHQMHMEPGSQMIFNPAMGDDIYHIHPAGMWMINYKFMHMYMSGLRAGTSDVGLDNIGYMTPKNQAMFNKAYNYMMIPTSMTMDMHMFMLMYGITDRLTVMGMATYQVNSMNMLMDMGMGAKPDNPMHTKGIGDTELRGIYKINNQLTGSLGLSLPTGDIEQTFVTMKRPPYRAPYDMQLGSGTYDLKPALTYNDLSADAKWNWGAQAMYTWHTAKNDNGWKYGDSFKLNGWLQRAFGPATSWLRMAFTDAAKIKGFDPEIQKLLDPDMMKGAPMPDADPNNYGGKRIDSAIGLSIKMGNFSGGIEGGIPLYQDLNGLQLKTKWFMTVGLQLMF